MIMNYEHFLDNYKNLNIYKATNIQKELQEPEKPLNDYENQ